MLKVLMHSINLTKTSKLQDFNEAVILCVCKLKANEWRSKPNTDPGLEAKFTHQLCSLEYALPTNIMYIEIRDKNKPAMKALAEGKIIINEFLENPDTIIMVPLTRGGDEVGEISFESPSGASGAVSRQS